MEDVTVLSLTARSNVNVTGNVNASFVDAGAGQIKLLNSNSVFISELLYTSTIECTGNATMGFANVLGDLTTWFIYVRNNAMIDGIVLTNRINVMIDLSNLGTNMLGTISVSGNSTFTAPITAQDINARNIDVRRIGVDTINVRLLLNVTNNVML